MFVPAPIDYDFVPYTKRAARSRNAELFVDSSGGKGRGGPRVVPQIISCSGKSDCWGPCHTFPNGTHLYCRNGECVATASECAR
jgi:hypothetical protein